MIWHSGEPVEWALDQATMERMMHMWRNLDFIIHFSFSILSLIVVLSFFLQYFFSYGLVLLLFINLNILQIKDIYPVLLISEWIDVCIEKGCKKKSQLTHLNVTPLQNSLMLLDGSQDIVWNPIPEISKIRISKKEAQDCIPIKLFSRGVLFMSHMTPSL